MKAKTSLAVVSVLALYGAAHAQSSVTMYGVIDVAVEHLSKTAPSGGGLTRMASLAGSVPSSLGFRGSEDLGGGLTAQFVLEMGIAPDSGSLNQGGRAFGRQSWVGLSGPWGSLGFGRQYTMLFWSMADAGVLGPHITSIGSFDSYLPNARADNAITYRGTFSGFTVGATYSLGRDVANAGPAPSGTNCAGESATDKKACREWSALLKYDARSWGATVGIDKIRGGPGAFAGLTSGALTDRRLSLNAFVRLGPAKVSGGVLRRDNEASPMPRSDVLFLGVSYPVTPQVTVDAQWMHYKQKASSSGADLPVVRVMYAFSKRSAVYASLSHIDNKGAVSFSAGGGQPGGNPVAGGTQNAVAVGLRHSF